MCEREAVHHEIYVVKGKSRQKSLNYINYLHTKHFWAVNNKDEVLLSEVHLNSSGGKYSPAAPLELYY